MLKSIIGNLKSIIDSGLTCGHPTIDTNDTDRLNIMFSSYDAFTGGAQNFTITVRNYHSSFDLMLCLCYFAGRDRYCVYIF